MNEIDRMIKFGTMSEEGKKRIMRELEGKGEAFRRMYESRPPWQVYRLQDDTPMPLRVIIVGCGTCTHMVKCCPDTYEVVILPEINPEALQHPVGILTLVKYAYSTLTGVPPERLVPANDWPLMPGPAEPASTADVH